MLDGRSPLPGPVSNIASWNYPVSVQVHAELVQVLAGNAVVAKTPTQGGFHCLTLAHALMVREGLPVTLLSGVGSKLGEALISSEGIGALALAEAIGIVLPEGPYETLAGFVQTQLGRVPEVGDWLEAHGHRFTVVEMDGRRVPGCGSPRRHPQRTTWRHPTARRSTGAVTGARPLWG